MSSCRYNELLYVWVRNILLVFKSSKWAFFTFLEVLVPNHIAYSITVTFVNILHADFCLKVRKVYEKTSPKVRGCGTWLPGRRLRSRRSVQDDINILYLASWLYYLKNNAILPVTVRFVSFISTCWLYWTVTSGFKFS